MRILKNRRLSEDSGGEAHAANLDWRPFSMDVLPTSLSGEAVAEMDQVLSVLAAARQQPGHVISYVLRNSTIPMAFKADADGTVFYATPSPYPQDFAMAGDGEDNDGDSDDLGIQMYPITALEGWVPPGRDLCWKCNTPLLPREAGATHRICPRCLSPMESAGTLGAQGDNTNYSNDDMKGNGAAQDRTEDDSTYSGQVGATDRGEASEEFELTPVDTDPRMAGEGLGGPGTGGVGPGQDPDPTARDYTAGFGNAESDESECIPEWLTEDTDYWDLGTGFGTYQGPDPFIRPLTYLKRQGLTDDSEDDSSASSKDEDADPRMTAVPPEDTKLLTEPSDEACEEAGNGCNGYDVPWGEPPEGYRKLDVGEHAAHRSFPKTTRSLAETLLK